MYLSFLQTNKMKAAQASINYFKALDQLQIAIFNCYIQKDDGINHFKYELKIHKSRVKILRTMKNIRIMNGQSSQDKLAKLENLYEIIFSLNTLKIRILDPATFEICEEEFKRISFKITDAIKHIVILLGNCSTQTSHTLVDDTAKIIGLLSNNIDAFEELYRSTLQVVSSEPIFFLFFVQDLIAFRDELESYTLELLHG